MEETVDTRGRKESADQDGIDRRGFLECMRWAGAGLLWTIQSGVPVSNLLAADMKHSAMADFCFIQISDSHIGFNKPANTDVNGTLSAAVEKINALPKQPDFIIHTGDITHLAKPGEFDTTEQILKGLRQKEVRYVPGEHDVTGDDGKEYFGRFAKDSPGTGWFSFDHKGVHFLGLNNVVQLEGMGRLGPDQLEWAKKDLARLSKSTPVVVFAHVPLWSVYPAWNWGTEDGEQLLSLLKPFGSITVLNGHIHQTMQKVEGNVTFHTAMSTAFPQPAPGQAAAPGPMKVPAEHLRMVLGVKEINFARGRSRLAVIDSPLASMDGSEAHSTGEGAAGRL